MQLLPYVIELPSIHGSAKAAFVIKIHIFICRRFESESPDFNLGALALHCSQLREACASALKEGRVRTFQLVAS